MLWTCPTSRVARCCEPWRALEHDRSSDGSGAVCDLADLFYLLHLSIPFDVQTAFYSLRAKAPREVARRLGFAEGA